MGLLKSVSKSMKGTFVGDLVKNTISAENIFYSE